MSAPAPEQYSNWSFRLILVCLVALSASLPMVWVSLVKLLLFLSLFVYPIADHFKKRVDNSLTHRLSAPTMLATLIAFSPINIIFNSMIIDMVPGHFYALTPLCLGWFDWPDDSTPEVST